ncbi:AmmeMemoRadiSam system radical SAM enzyme [Candidatus Woesearchaeota archaeon]|nr:AmmeMemoRadiSam system radical SAM enzyme [Candidatus Woesearchaeota archaeon]
MKKKTFLDKNITRREFVKKSIIVVGGVSLAVYAIKNSLFKDVDTISTFTFRNDAPEELWKWSREADFYSKNGKEVQCNLCPRGCFLGPADRGYCRTRINKDGKLYTLSYGNPTSVHVDPIEKKPLFHYLPGTKAFSIATNGCNLRCLYCQNWDISQKKPEETKFFDLLPEALVEAVVQAKEKDPALSSVAYTYSDPLAFYEYMVDSAKLLRKQGIKTVVITAGYFTPESMKELARNVDAIKIDLKGFNEDFYREVTSAHLDGVLEAIKIVNKSDAWLEIVNLLVPTLNDDMDEMRDMSRWVVDNIGKDVPIHFSRFHPDYKLRNLPATPINSLKKAREIAIEEGINYAYIGNVPHDDYENTYCPKCKSIAIERIGYIIKQNNIVDGKCSECGERIAGVWKL